MGDSRRVLITGATGFVGPYLIAHLAAGISDVADYWHDIRRARRARTGSVRSQ